MNTPKVKHFAPNHTTIEQGDAEYLQSYKSIVVKKAPGQITLGRHWDHSKTTAKYVGKYLGRTAKEIRKALEMGEYDYDEELI